jgi:CheY-like chemotaxis protein
VRIVVVDDNVDVREPLVELLALEGTPVEEAADGPSGPEPHHCQPTDAALVDIGLPGFDGYEPARRARHARRIAAAHRHDRLRTDRGQPPRSRPASTTTSLPVSLEDIETALNRRQMPGDRRPA